jgi:tetratricopeptide (TPR) repeat protein
MDKIEELAQARGLWEELIGVYDGERSRSREPADHVDSARKIAGVCEEKLLDPARAFEILRDALPHEPSGETLLPELERLARVTGDWASRLDVYARVARGRPAVADRVLLLRTRADVREQKMNDPAGALADHLRAFALAPDEEDTRASIMRLAEITGRWEDAIGVEAQLFGRATDTDARVEVACRAARLVEEKVKDRLRAFRAYLNAFRLSPENDAVVSNLWRLARAIGRYSEEAPESLDDEALIIDEDVEVLEEIEDIDADLVPETPSAAVPAVPLIPAPQKGGFQSAWEELAAAYEELPAPDRATRHGYLRRIAEIWERGPEDIDKAFETLERAFRLDITEASARADIWRLAEQRGRWDDATDILLRAVDLAGREDAVALHREVAARREELVQLGAAEECYEAILVLQPEDTQSLDRLEDIFREQERWGDLARLLEKRTTGAVEALPPGSLRRRKSLELAGLYERRLERPYEAIDTLERYVQSIDEDERGTDNPDVVRDSSEAYEALCRLHGRVGMWSKAAQALVREIDLTTDAAALRDLRWRAAQIYEGELKQPDEAVKLYEAILDTAPGDVEVLAALDRSYETHGRYEALEQLLERRADLAKGPEKSDLIRRRAKILEEKLQNPDAAAACLRSLGNEALRDEEMTGALLRNLRSSGLGDEAHRILQQRIDILTKERAPLEQLVALDLELSNLRLDQLNDPDGALEAIEGALERAPGNPEALDALARLHLKRADFAAYAKARMRQGKAQKGTAEAAVAYLEAGRVFRDQLGNPSEARKCFQRAVKEQPQNQEALRSLASLLASQGEVAEARALFERQLELSTGGAARAPILTDLARTLWEKPGDAPTVIPFLDEAIQNAPDYLPAVMTMADIYYKEHQWDQAELRLTQVLRRLRGQGESQSSETAQLYYRLAEIYEKLGRLDDGYRHLVEGDRSMPGQLLVRLALGENRFQAKKWREAAAHFEGIAEHPDAGHYPDEVVQGLAHAAQAEIKVKRPERALPLYEAALRLVPDHRLSLRALADLALERGEKRDAATYLRRLAESSGEREEKAHLFEQLGDIYKGLDDVAESRRAYEAALGLIGEATEANIPLLGKALAAQREAGAAEEAAETSQRLINLEPDPKERAARRREAAAILIEQGVPERAAEYLERALADNPADEEVLLALCEAYDRAGKSKQVGALLERVAELPVIEGEPPAGAQPRARKVRADLWERLGASKRESDRGAAIASFERAVEIDPDRSSARLALVDLYGDTEAHREAALRHHHALVQADITRVESLRALANASLADGKEDAARCQLELLALFGAATDEDRKFLTRQAKLGRKADDPYGWSLDEVDRIRYLAPPEARVMAEIFAAIWEAVPGLAGPTLESLGVEAQDKISPMSELTIGKVSGQAAKALANTRASLYVSADPGFDKVAITVVAPPSIVVGQRLATSEDVAEMRFQIGRALELTRPEYILAATVAPKEFAQLFSGVLKAFHPRHARRRAGSEDGANDQATKLKKALPYKVAKRMADLFQENDATPFSSARWRSVVQHTGDRAGLLLCGDLAAAADAVLRESVGEMPDEIDAEIMRAHAGKEGPLRELLRFAVSEEYLALRAVLGAKAPA